jgi:DNA-binding NarL/FixJ family response regulator
MDFIQFLLISGVVTGCIMIIVSFTSPKSAVKKVLPEREKVIDKRLEEIDTTITEADNIITELGDISQDVIREMDQKYSELLFLYNLIDEKKKAIEVPVQQVIAPDISNKIEDFPKPQQNILPPKPPNPRLARILEMKQGGMSIAQIAKELDMGQGEVSLMINLRVNN